MLVRTEALRAALRATPSPQRMLLVRALLDSVSYIMANKVLSDDAGILRPPELRSHLAAARSLGANLGAFVTYDQTAGRCSRLVRDSAREPALTAVGLGWPDTFAEPAAAGL